MEVSPRRRFPGAIVAILIIIIIGLAGFAAFKVGWLETPISGAQAFISGLKLPQWLPISSKDTTPPVISEVKISDISANGAVVTWKTDEPATSQVMICEPAGTCTWTQLDENLVTDHSVTVEGLKPNLTYKITASSSDAAENQQTEEQNLTTLAQVTTSTPAISGVTQSNITGSSASITWQTDQPATGQVEYGTSAAYGSTSSVDQNLSASHSVVLAGLQPNTTYHFKVKSKDAGGNEVACQDQTFTTLSAVSPAVGTGTAAGQRAPGFTLSSLDGKTVNLSDFRGEATIITFWTSSQQCRNQLTAIEGVYKTWPQKSQLAIIGVNVGESDKDAQKAVTQLDLSFTILLDTQKEVYKTYDVVATPTTFFIDTQGLIKYAISQRQIRDTEIEDKLKAISSS